MKVLLDECLPVDFRHYLPGHEIHTAQFAGFKGVKNGRLLTEAEAAGYEVFLTVDRGIPDEQNLAGRRIAILIVRSKTNQIEDLVPLVASILQSLQDTRPGQLSIVDKQRPDPPTVTQHSSDPL